VPCSPARMKRYSGVSVCAIADSFQLGFRQGYCTAESLNALMALTDDVKLPCAGGGKGRSLLACST
jgi:hypothetical protein